LPVRLEILTVRGSHAIRNAGTMIVFHVIMLERVMIT
jgi:hypothetical protein